MTLPLMQKDLRLLRPVLVGLAVLAVFLLAVLPASVALDWHNDPTANMELGRSGFAGLFVEQAYKGSLMLTAFTLLTLAVIGGMAFAQERRERWADFAAMLPVPRGRAVAAKLATSAGVCVLLLVGATAIRLAAEKLAGGADGWIGYAQARSGDGPATNGLLAATAVALFGLAWLGSSLLDNAVLATVLSVAAVGGLAFWRFVGLVTGPDAWFVVRTATWQSAAVAGFAGLLGVVVGSVVQTRRVSP